MAGWGILRKFQERLSQEVAEYYFAAETADEFHYRKGYMDGHLRTLGYSEVLIAVAETSDEEFAQAELSKLLAPFRAVTLPRIEDQEGEVKDRISRVLERARSSEE